MENPTLKRAIVAALFVVLGAVDAFAQTAQLQQISLIHGRGGFNRQESGDGALREGEVSTHYFWLSAGNEYRINGTCDNDCRDVDLVLFSPSGTQVDVDRLLDDIPQVTVRPRRSGWHRVDVEMAHCSSEPCFYAVAVHGR